MPDYAPSAVTVTFTVTKGSGLAPTFKPRGKISAKKAGAATITVAAAAGLAKPGGKVKVTLTKGRTTKKDLGHAREQWPRSWPSCPG